MKYLGMLHKYPRTEGFEQLTCALLIRLFNSMWLLGHYAISLLTYALAICFSDVGEIKILVSASPEFVTWLVCHSRISTEMNPAHAIWGFIIDLFSGMR